MRSKDLPLDKERLCTIKEVAARLQVSSRTVRRLIDRGELSRIQIGRGIRIHPSDVKRLERPVPPSY